MTRAARVMGKKGGLRRKETTTKEERAAWGRTGGLMAGRGRPKKAAAASAKVRSAKAKARKREVKPGISTPK